MLIPFNPARRATPPKKTASAPHLLPAGGGGPDLGGPVGGAPEMAGRRPPAAGLRLPERGASGPEVEQGGLGAGLGAHRLRPALTPKTGAFTRAAPRPATRCAPSACRRRPCACWPSTAGGRPSSAWAWGSGGRTPPTCSPGSGAGPCTPLTWGTGWPGSSSATSCPT